MPETHSKTPLAALAPATPCSLPLPRRLHGALHTAQFADGRGGPRPRDRRTGTVGGREGASAACQRHGARAPRGSRRPWAEGARSSGPASSRPLTIVSRVLSSIRRCTRLLCSDWLIGAQSPACRVSARAASAACCGGLQARAGPLRAPGGRGPSPSGVPDLPRQAGMEGTGRAPADFPRNCRYGYLDVVRMKGDRESGGGVPRACREKERVNCLPSSRP